MNVQDKFSDIVNMFWRLNTNSKADLIWIIHIIIAHHCTDFEAEIVKIRAHNQRENN